MVYASNICVFGCVPKCWPVWVFISHWVRYVSFNDSMSSKTVLLILC